MGNEQQHYGKGSASNGGVVILVSGVQGTV
jgi:hypothetical protein